jgi:tRNA threonylcarbamoyladenosine biosynthesis protein TsaB
MILALKTADFSTTLELYRPDGSLSGELHWESGRELSAQLLTRIQELLRGSQAQLRDLQGIIVFSGPGSFTSLRIGHSVANSLADSLAIPIVGAAGSHWQTDGLAALPKAKSGRPALPIYGAEAHITKPKTDSGASRA